MSIPGFSPLPPKNDGSDEWKKDKSVACIRKVGELQTKLDALPPDDRQRAEVIETIMGLKSGDLLVHQDALGDE